MGKSFVMQVFIKECVISGDPANFAVIVPSKALINEVSGAIIKDLQELLPQKNYRVVTSAGAVALEDHHNFIFVLTPERLLYLLIQYDYIDIDYLFIDEAHKISVGDSRSAFYYKVIDMLLQREKKPHIIFASPNIPNPDVYLELLSGIEKESHNLSSAFSPVSQVKYIADFVTGSLQVFNEHNQNFVTVTNDGFGTFHELLMHFYKQGTNTLVYINSKDEAMREAEKFARRLPVLNDKDLDSLANEIKLLVHKDCYLAKLLSKGVAVHIGYLPSAVRMRIEELYRDRKIRTLFCTSTLVEGVNLPADNLFMTTYGRGGSNLTEVEFRNLVGRVGRIKYNLYGNVFLTRLDDQTKPAKYIEYLKKEIPEQRLSLMSDLTDEHKALIVDCFAQGEHEIPKVGIKESTYGLLRKFSIILLHDIMKDRFSVVRNAFEPLLNEKNISEIKAAFEDYENKPDDDINASVDQTNCLAAHISQGLEYPNIHENGCVSYDDILAFLEKLHFIFKWDKYENAKTIGNKSRLRWHAATLKQWINGCELNSIAESALDSAQRNIGKHNQKKVYINKQYVPFDDSPLHRNLVISETLEAIENVILFSFSNCFYKFSECYKHKKGITDAIPNDWYEYVEYGTTDPLCIMLQKNGFSREASFYIKENEDIYIVTINGVDKLNKKIADCQRESIQREAANILFNAPELFIE